MSTLLESLVRDQDHQTQANSAFAELLAFLLVGGLMALLFVVLSSLVVGLGLMPAWIASALCYAAAVVPAYLLHRRFSFHSDAPHSRAFSRYVLVQLSAIVLASLFSFVAYGVVGLPTLAAAITVSALTAAVNFTVLKLWAFGRVA